MNEHIVAKFGGSSVKDASAMKRCAEIVWNNPDTKVVILSATYNTTNMLEEFARQSFASLKPDILSKIVSQHDLIINDLKCSENTKKSVNELYGELVNLGKLINEMQECSPKLMDSIYAIGERLSTAIFVDLLGQKKEVVLVDAREVIITDSIFNRANPQLDEIKHRAKLLINSEINQNKIVVTQGFIGKNLHGDTTTLGREGSDYSAALLGEATNASLIQIWTDVAGVYTTDPKFYENAKLIERMSYSAAAKLAQNGSKVLFSETMSPAERANIPIEVNSSIRPVKLGTIIDNNEADDFIAMAVAKDQVLISFTPSEGIEEDKFTNQIHDLVGKCQTYEFANKKKGASINIISSKKNFLKDEVIKKIATFSMVKIIGGFFRVTFVGAKCQNIEVQNELINNIAKISTRSVAIYPKCQSDFLLSVLIPDDDYSQIMPYIHNFMDKI